MAQIKILKFGEIPLCLVAGVPMPDGTKRDYVETGINGLADIISRIRADKAFIACKQRRSKWLNLSE